jgi:hypothetical protein
MVASWQYRSISKLVRSEAVSLPRPGPHTLMLQTDRGLAPGVYWVRIKQGTESVAARLAIVQ